MKNKPEIVVITGASAGVGRAVAREFARHGAHIGLIARDRQRLEAARSEIEAAGGRALELSADVADAEQVERAAATVEDTFGPIDIWINGAMTTVFSPFIEIRPEEFRRVTEVTYLGNVHGTQAALKRMQPRNRGTIVQISSALAYRSVPLQTAYCGAKHAIQGFTEALRVELMHGRSKVHVTVVDLPGMNTPQFNWCKSRLPHRAQPVPPIYQPEVAARAIFWAAHQRRRQVYVGGSTVLTILGNRLAPWLLDRYLARAAWSGQQTGEPSDPDRPDNLWQPVAGDPGARGRFNRQARNDSLQLWATMHRRGIALTAAGAATGAVFATAAARYLRRRLR